jgi:hypothetical protein
MKLTNAYIIDGDVIEKMKSELKEDIQLYTETEIYCDDLKHKLKAIEEIEQHLKPVNFFLTKDF